jgi:hypothetical protein
MERAFSLRLSADRWADTERGIMASQSAFLGLLQAAAKANAGKPPGEPAFYRAAGLTKKDLWAAGFASYGAACEAAGLHANTLTPRLPDGDLLQRLATLARELGRYPPKGAFEVARAADQNFPSWEAFKRREREGPEHSLREILVAWCLKNGEFSDVAAMLEAVTKAPSKTPRGNRYVVIYVEPKDDGYRNLTTNTSRTSLLVNSEPLPWVDWAAEFRENLSSEIAQLVAEKAAAASNTDHSKSIRDRLRDILDLFRISRYRPTAAGTILIDEERLARGGRLSDSPREPHSSGDGGKPGGPGGGAGSLYAVFEKPGGAPGKRVKPDPFPEVKWVTVKNGTREYGDIEDRAAKYHSDQNILLANADFRVFADMVAFFVKEFDEVPGIEELARDAVRGWFEQALVEAVMGVQGLMNSKEWSQTDIDAALSEEALTTAVMQRYHVHFAVKRELASKVGSRRASATG